MKKIIKVRIISWGQADVFMAVFGDPGSFVPKYRFKLSDLSYHGNKVIS